MYLIRQTRVSIFLHPSVSTITPGFIAWNDSHKTFYSAFLSRLLKKRKPLQKLLAVCRVKEDHPHFVTMQQHNVCLQNRCVMPTPFSTVLLNAPHSCLPLLLHLMKYLF